MLRVKGKGPVFRLERSQKALMIEAVLHDHLQRFPEGLSILDIGCGNGDICAHFARRNKAFGVDVDDRRKPGNTSFQFSKVTSESLPFSGTSFDVVISHHVIEHVHDQRLHLAEISRVLRTGGVAYLATPNRSSPIMQGHIGNDMVLRYRQMRPLFEGAGFAVSEYSTKVVKYPRRFHAETGAFSWLPSPVLSGLRRWFPSHVFVLTRNHAGAGGAA